MLDPILSSLQMAPSSATVITTYQCTAACKDCCFESNPNLRGRLSSEEIIGFLREAKEAFDSLKLVVFSGGEPLLLGDSLFESIAAASELGLLTRVVTNGYWGKTQGLANKTATRLAAAGLSEINISTGTDHSAYVSLDSVASAIEALASHGIPNRVTVESENAGDGVMDRILNHPAVVNAMNRHQGLTSFQTNSWMPFHEDSQRRPLPTKNVVASPCKQLFNNIVLTPHKQLSACCGLTFEHIQDLKLGRYEKGLLKAAYSSQFDDFLKVWIAVDGPLKIVERVMGSKASAVLGEIHHGCQACAILHNSPTVRERLVETYSEHVPDVLSRFIATTALDRMGAEEEVNLEYHS